MPYTYLLTHKPSGRRYYGVRTAHTLAPEEDLWREYFSSSDLVLAIVEAEGRAAFNFEIRKVFTQAEAAVAWETRVLKRMRVKEREDWLNRNDSQAPPILRGTNNGFHGRVHSETTKKTISEKAKKRWLKNRFRYAMVHANRRKPKLSDELKRRKSIIGKANIEKLFAGGRKGKKNPMYGKRHSVDTRLKMREAKAGLYEGTNNPMWGRGHDEKAKKAIAESRKGRRWINDGLVSKSVKSEELESYVLAGWALGRST